MEPNEFNKKETKAFPPEMYERAKAAKEQALTLAAEIKGKNYFSEGPEDFDKLEEAVAKQSEDVRIVISLGRFQWVKGVWEFDTPSTRAVMHRMSNLEHAKEEGPVPSNYLELHVKYDYSSFENKEGFRRHTVSHNLYVGSYKKEETNIAE